MSRVQKATVWERPGAQGRQSLVWEDPPRTSNPPKVPFRIALWRTKLYPLTQHRGRWARVSNQGDSSRAQQVLEFLSDQNGNLGAEFEFVRVSRKVYGRALPLEDNHNK